MQSLLKKIIVPMRRGRLEGGAAEQHDMQKGLRPPMEGNDPPSIEGDGYIRGTSGREGKNRYTLWQKGE